MRIIWFREMPPNAGSMAGHARSGLMTELQPMPPVLRLAAAEIPAGWTFPACPVT